MDPTRPAKVDPEKFVSSILAHGVTYSFGSPAIWNVVSRYCLDKKIKLHSLKKVLMAGAPVPGELLERVTAILPADAEIFTPYGATESLPVISMTGKEILEKTWQHSRVGKGTCVGRPLPGIDLKVIQIQDEAIEFYDSDLDVPVTEMGEIIVRGNVVTRAYENNERETKLSKIKDKGSDTFWHRMGDTGYLDETGRLWFCGRKAHRVITDQGTLFTIPCEAIVNEHKDVYRSALVGVPQKIGKEGSMPVLIVEPVKGCTTSDQDILDGVRRLAAASPVTSQIKRFLIHPDFPVDIRHNAKIFREKLALWAVGKTGEIT
jgi:acyl-CoA synthetase (AMP-forming)/AMP-acid ligase II